MALTAPLSKYKIKNFVIYIVVCLGLAAWLYYDGHFNKKFIDKHTGKDGLPDKTLVAHLKGPPYFIGAAALLCLYLFIIRNRKVVADDNQLIVDDKTNIAYDVIVKIDKTHFDSKGYFIITCRGPDGKEVDHKLSDRNYDNLGPILDHLVAKIS